MMFKKVSVYLFIVITISIISFTLGVRYNNNQRFSEFKRLYINHIYAEIDSTIFLLSSVENWGESINNTDVTVNPYRQLLGKLESKRIKSEQASMYIRNNQMSVILRDVADSYRLIGGSIGGGVSYNNQHICNDFIYDGVLSENEIAFLTSIKQDLENIKSGLYSEETKQANPNLSVIDFGRVFKPFTDKYTISNLPNIGLKN